MRRLIASLLLILSTALNVEAVTGILRDGAVHHEDAAAAAVHADGSSGDHGHEDASSPAEHDENHEHGTSSDHCTHQHGMALVPVVAFTVVSTEALIYHSERLLPHPTISESPVHPPRA